MGRRQMEMGNVVGGVRVFLENMLYQRMTVSISKKEF